MSVDSPLTYAQARKRFEPLFHVLLEAFSEDAFVWHLGRVVDLGAEEERTRELVGVCRIIAERWADPERAAPRTKRERIEDLQNTAHGLLDLAEVLARGATKAKGLAEQLQDAWSELADPGFNSVVGGVPVSEGRTDPPRPSVN